MKKTDLVRELSTITNMTQKSAEQFLSTFLELIDTHLRDGEIIPLTGLGTFQLKVCPPRKARNPRTGEEIQLSERTVPIFKPFPTWKKSFVD